MDRTCPVCGKVFSFSCTEEEWGYAYNNQLTCSYHCMRDMEMHRNKKRPNPKSMGRFIYKNMCCGKTYEEIAETATARTHNLGSADKVKTYIDKWIHDNQAEARTIEADAERDRTMFNRKQVAVMVGKSPESVRNTAENINIFGERHGGKVYYTRQEINAIKNAIRGESA